MHSAKDKSNVIDDLEKELREARDIIKRSSAVESDIKELKLSISEKEQYIQKMSVTLADLNREKVNTSREIRKFYEKHLQVQNGYQAAQKMIKDT